MAWLSFSRAHLLRSRFDFDFGSILVLRELFAVSCTTAKPSDSDLPSTPLQAGDGGYGSCGKPIYLGLGTAASLLTSS
jgi:hypothetical protein